MTDTWTCVLSLKPVSWIQTVGNGESALTSSGQSLLMVCAPVEDSNLELSDGTRVQGLKVFRYPARVSRYAGMEHDSNGVSVFYRTIMRARTRFIQTGQARSVDGSA
jgi:hypothetical protein